MVNSFPTHEMIRLYLHEHLTLRDIGRIAGMSYAGVRRRLLEAGISSADAVCPLIYCSFCGKEFRQYRSRVRGKKRLYCSVDCWAAGKENPNLVPQLRGGRLVRSVVGQHFRLLPPHVVVHLDGNDRNNDLNNLGVVGSVSEYVRYLRKKFRHKGKEVAFLWRGSEVPR
jgi:hypothetical protein